MADWLRKPYKRPYNVSIVWRGLLHSLLVVKERLSWKISRGSQVWIGIDPFVGSVGNFKISAPLLDHIHSENLQVLLQIKRHHCIDGNRTYWLMASDLDLHDDLAAERNRYIMILNEAGIVLSDIRDVLVWDKDGVYDNLSAKNAYETISGIFSSSYTTEMEVEEIMAMAGPIEDTVLYMVVPGKQDSILG